MGIGSGSPVMVEPNATRFKDRVAIVTGSTRSIGAAIAKRLAAVTVSGRSVERGRSVAEDIRSRGVTRRLFVRTCGNRGTSRR